MKFIPKLNSGCKCEIYGEPLVHPQVESYRGNVNTIGIRSCYDEGKRISETLFFDFWRMYDVRIKVVRIFNTYGPYMQIDDGWLSPILSNRHSIMKILQFMVMVRRREVSVMCLIWCVV